MVVEDVVEWVITGVGVIVVCRDWKRAVSGGTLIESVKDVRAKLTIHQGSANVLASLQRLLTFDAAWQAGSRMENMRFSRSILEIGIDSMGF